MKCCYCSTYQVSAIRPNNGTRFCISIRDMTEATGFCDNYNIADLFWCDKSSCWLSFPMCIARQDKELPECTHCRQKKDIWDAKRFAGRQIKREKSILVRR